MYLFEAPGFVLGIGGVCLGLLEVLPLKFKLLFQFNLALRLLAMNHDHGRGRRRGLGNGGGSGSGCGCSGTDSFICHISKDRVGEREGPIGRNGQERAGTCIRMHVVARDCPLLPIASARASGEIGSR